MITAPAPDSHLFAIATQLQNDRVPFVLATVIAAQGSCFAEPGFKAIFDREGADLSGWIGGGCAQSAVAYAAIEAIESENPQLVDVDLNDEVLGAGLPCGGALQVFVDPVLPPPRVWVLGHGRMAEAFDTLCAFIGLDVVVCEDIAHVVGTRTNDFLQPGTQDFVIISSQHANDQEALKQILASSPRYIALLASKKRGQLIMDHLRAEGVSEDALARVRSPAGVDLNARTPEEVAVEVVSEILLVRRTKVKPVGGCPLEGEREFAITGHPKEPP